MSQSFRRRLALQTWLVAAALLLGFGLVVRTISLRYSEALTVQQMIAIGNDVYNRVLLPDLSPGGGPRDREFHGHSGRPSPHRDAPDRDGARRDGPPGPGGNDASSQRPPFDFAAMNPDGEVVFVSPLFPAAAELPPAGYTPAPDPVVDRMTGPLFQREGKRGGDFARLTIDGTDYYRVHLVADAGLVAVVASTDGVDQQMAQLDRALLIALVVALVVLLPLAWWQSNRVLRPVRQITAVAREISDQSLDARVPADGVDQEFHELIRVLNDMLGRLEQSFGQARRFSADAAHELRTPLTVLQGEIEAALNSADTGSAQQQSFSGLLDEVEHLKVITRKLLLLSLADAAQLPLDRAPVDLTTLLADLAEDAELLGPHLALHLQVPAGLRLRADVDLLTQGIRNLLSNAVKYNTPPGADAEAIVGSIVIQAEHAGDRIRIRVGNTGKTIASGDTERVFDRFYRADAAHSRKVAGAGLGLSLTREIVRAHGGTLHLATAAADSLTDPGSGAVLTTFVIDLPADQGD